MRVLVLGGGVIGVSVAYYLVEAGHEVELIERRGAAAMETSFANAGEVSPGYSAPWAGPGRADQGDPLDADAAQPAGHLAAARPGHVALGRDDAGQLHEPGLRAQQEPHGADRRVQPRLPEGAARRHRHQLRRARAGHAAVVSHAEATRWHGQGHRRAARSTACPTRCSTAPASSPSSRACATRSTSSSARCACPATRPATAICSRSAWPRWRRHAARGCASTPRSWGSSAIGDRITGVRTTAGTLSADAVVHGAGQLHAVAAEATEAAHPGVSGQGLLDHAADRRCAARARVDHHGRDAQGRRHAAGRAHPRRRHGRAGRLQPGAARGAARHAGPRGERSVPRRRRPGARRVLVRPAADDARWHADHRPDAAGQPASWPPATARSAGRWPPAPAA